MDIPASSGASSFAAGQRRLAVKLFRKARKEWCRLWSLPIRLFPGSTSTLACLLAERQRLTPEQVILNYAQGLYPLGTPRGIKWEDPPERAIMAVEAIYIEKELDRLIRQGRFQVTFDQDFSSVLAECSRRDGSWINQEIIETFEELHRWGVAHSFEVWGNGQLAGGGYGLGLGSTFISESQFFKIRNAAKVGFVQLAERLRQGGYKLIDHQNPTAHWLRFGAVKVSRAEYKRRLARALTEQASFHASPASQETGAA